MFAYIVFCGDRDPLTLSVEHPFFDCGVVCGTLCRE
jgi:hypothetical protein